MEFVDIFANFVLSGALTVGVWILGIFILKRNSATDGAFVRWLKVWAITAGLQAFLWSTLLTVVFPDPNQSSVLSTFFGI